MSLTFPIGSANGAFVTQGNRTWQYDAAANAWRSYSSAALNVPVGNTAPPNPVDGQLWYENQFTHELYVYSNGANNWLSVTGAGVSANDVPGATSNTVLSSGSLTGNTLTLTSADGSSVDVDVSPLAENDFASVGYNPPLDRLTITLNDGSTSTTDLGRLRLLTGTVSGSNLELGFSDGNTVIADLSSLAVTVGNTSLSNVAFTAANSNLKLLTRDGRDFSVDLSTLSAVSNVSSLTDVANTPFTNGAVLTYFAANGTWSPVRAVGSEVSSTAPAAPYVGQLWFEDTVTGELYVWEGTNWVSVTGAIDDSYVTSGTYFNANTTLQLVQGGVGGTIDVDLSTLLGGDSNNAIANVEFTAANNNLKILTLDSREFSIDLSTLTSNTSLLDDIAKVPFSNGEVLTYFAANTTWTPTPVIAAPVTGTAPSSPYQGQLWFDDVTTGEMFLWDGANWVSVVGGTGTLNHKGAYVSQGTAQAIANNTSTVVTLNTEDYDTDSAFDNTTYTYTVPAGVTKVRASGSVAYQAIALAVPAADCYFEASIDVSSKGEYKNKVSKDSGTTEVDVPVQTGVVAVSAGDTIQLKTLHTAGAGQTTLANITRTYISIEVVE